MKLSSIDGFFDGLPPEFVSPFPSTDAFYSSRVNALLQKIDVNGGLSFAEALFAQQQARAWRDANALANAAAAKAGLSVLQQMLPKVSWFESGSQGAKRKGMWAPVDFQLSANPADLLSSLAEAGLQIALNAVQAVPIAGQIIQAVVGIGRLLYRLFNRPDPVVPPLTLPWARYSKDVDEQLVRNMIVRASGGESTDLSPVFMPPAKPLPWLLGQGIQNDKPVEGGQVWSPAKDNGEPDWTDGLGCMPGTVRVAGTVQRVLWRRTAEPRLSRFFRDYASAEIPWGSATTDTGDYYPALAQAGSGLWQQCQKAGVPLMYMLDVPSIKQRWIDWFDFMFSSAWARYPVDPSVGELLAPYIACYRQWANTDTAPSWRLGIQNMERPMPAPFVTPNIFTNGPAMPATRTNCLFVERRVQHRTGAWPWARLQNPGQLPEAHPSMDYRSFAYQDAKGFSNVDEQSRWRAVKAGMSFCGGDPVKPCKDIPKGYVCVPWPTGEELLTGYGRPDAHIIGPACDRMRKLQERCLESTLVCAVVRPTGDKRFAAFNDKALRDKCVEMRKLLLTHPARFQVRLADVDPIDAEFGQALRDSGVTNTPGQLNAQLGKAGGGIVPEDEEPLPEPLPPSRGVAFDNLPPQRYSLLWGPN